jgi:hypothetical protein
VLVRNITNNHSPARAAELLLCQHRYGQGSGSLGDYLENVGLRQQRRARITRRAQRKELLTSGE